MHKKYLLIKFILLLFILRSVNAQSDSFSGKKVQVVTFMNPGSEKPCSIAVDDSGNIFIADAGNNRIIKIAKAGQTDNFIYGLSPSILIFGRDNNLYGVSGNTIYRIFKNGKYVKIAGGTDSYPFKDGSTKEATFSNISGMAVDKAGTIFLADYQNQLIRKISNGVVSTYGAKKGQPGPYAYIQPPHFDFPSGIVIDDKGNLYISESSENKILKATPDDSVTVYVGNGIDNIIDAEGTKAGLSWVQGLAIDKHNNIFVADAGNNKIRMITPNRNVITIAGSGEIYKNEKDGDGAKATFNTPMSLSLDNEGNIYVVENYGRNVIRKIILPHGFIENILKNDKPVKNTGRALNNDSILQLKKDSLTANWKNISPANPDNFSQKQYAGKIGDNSVFLNVNLNIQNLRDQREMDIYASIGNNLYDFYFYEAELYGKLERYGGCSVLDSSYLKNQDKFTYNKKYLEGVASGFLQKPQWSLIVRFIDDSTKLEGYLIDNTLNKEPAYFILNQSKPSMVLNYKVVCFHKNAKAIGDSIIEVAATVSYSTNLPGKDDKHYLDFLNKQTGGLIGIWSGDATAVHYISYAMAVAKYKNEFKYAEKASHVHWARSLVGGYDNSEIICNQNNWLVIKQATFAGSTEAYGMLNTHYIVYDVKNKTFLNRNDVLVNKESIQDLIDKDVIQNLRYDYAFVCPDGIAFRTQGNHGWRYNFYLMEWKDALPILSVAFKKKYSYFWKNMK